MPANEPVLPQGAGYGVGTYLFKFLSVRTPTSHSPLYHELLYSEQYQVVGTSDTG